jgi:hypothetical protein
VAPAAAPAGPYERDADQTKWGCDVAVRADGSFEPRCRHEGHLPRRGVKKLVIWDEHVRAVIWELGVAPRSLPSRATANGLV